jgi:hypothetical protein
VATQAHRHPPGLVAALADRYPDRTIHLVADGAYAGKTSDSSPRTSP